MKKYLLPPLASIIATYAITHGGVASSLTNLFIAGIIPGTHFVLPFWLMMVLYCLAITIIVTVYVETILISSRTSRISAAHKQHLPRRRYSKI